MKKQIIEQMVRTGQLRARWKDEEKIKSILKSANTNADVVKGIKLTENSATVIFREVYESIRQLGNASWWILGYEPLNHEISIEILKEMDIKEKLKLNYLSRFKKIRNDANYRGFQVTLAQAEEILDFWNSSGKEIILLLSK